MFYHFKTNTNDTSLQIFPKPHKYTENGITKALVKGAPGHIMGFMFK